MYEQGGWDVGLNHKGWRRKIVLGALRVKTKRVLKGIQKASDGVGRERGGINQWKGRAVNQWEGGGDEGAG